MRRTARVLGGMALACAAVPLLPSGLAQADVRTETASIGAYYWTVIQPPTDTPLGPQEIPPKAQVRGTDGVAEDDLPVAVTAPGEPDKFSAVFFELLGLEGATVKTARLTVPISTAEDSNTTSREPDNVVACTVDDRGFADVDGEATEDSPGVLCNTFKASARLGPNDTFVFDITALAQRWADGENNGLALYPADPNIPFQTVFAKKNQIRLAIDYSPTAPSDPPVSPPTGPVAPPADPGGTGSTDVPPISGGSIDPPLDQPPVEQPEAAPPTGGTPQPAVRNVAATDGDLSPTGSFWAAAIGLTGLLVLLSLVLGHASPPRPVRVVGASPLTKALEQRQRGSNRPSPV